MYKDFKTTCDRCGKHIPSDIKKKYVFYIYWKHPEVKPPWIYDERHISLDLCEHCYKIMMEHVTELGRCENTDILRGIEEDYDGKDSEI